MRTTILAGMIATGVALGASTVRADKPHSDKVWSATAAEDILDRARAQAPQWSMAARARLAQQIAAARDAVPPVYHNPEIERAIDELIARERNRHTPTEDFILPISPYLRWLVESVLNLPGGSNDRGQWQMAFLLDELGLVRTETGFELTNTPPTIAVHERSDLQWIAERLRKLSREDRIKIATYLERRNNANKIKYLQLGIVLMGSVLLALLIGWWIGEKRREWEARKAAEQEREIRARLDRPPEPPVQGPVATLEKVLKAVLEVFWNNGNRRPPPWARTRKVAEPPWGGQSFSEIHAWVMKHLQDNRPDKRPPEEGNDTLPKAAE